MTVKELFDFIKGVRPGFAFTDAQLTVWLNEIEGHVQTDIWLLEPAVDETQTGLVEYDSTIDTETGEMVDANHELLVPFPWNKLYRYFLLMSIDLANGEYQRYANSYELFNEAYEEYAGWYAQHVSPANGDAITRGYYISAYQFAARGGYAGTEKDFIKSLNRIDSTAADLQALVDEAEVYSEEAGNERIGAEAANENAQKWATGGTGQTPTAGNSAKHYAEQALAAINEAKLSTVIKETSGQEITFNDGIGETNLKELLLHVTPTQEGTGTPSINNVRPIVGCSTVTFTFSDGAQRTHSDEVSFDYEYTVTIGSNTYTGSDNVLYDGTYDAAKKTLTINKVRRVFTGNSSELWYLYSAANGFYVHNPMQGSVTGANGLCNILPKAPSVAQKGFIIGVGNNNYIYFTRVFDDWGVNTVADLRTWLATHNIEVVFPLPSPVVIENYDQPVDLTIYDGYNSIANDYGSMDIEYIASTQKYIDSNIANAKSITANVESTNTATEPYAVDSYVIVGNTLYRVTTSINVGQTISPGVNCVATTIGDEVYSIQDDLQTGTTALTSGKVNIPRDGNNQPTNGTSGQVLRTNGDGTTEWANAAQPTDEQTNDAVDAWFSDHPEAYAAVEDGSLTKSKFSVQLIKETIKDYVTPEMYGAVGDGATDDTEAVSAALESGKAVALNKTYKVTSGITIHRPVNLFSFSRGGIIGSTTNYIINVEKDPSSGLDYRNYYIVNVSIRQTGTGNALQFAGWGDYLSQVKIINCRIGVPLTNASGWAIYCDNSLAHSVIYGCDLVGNSIYANVRDANVIEKNLCYGQGTGIRLETGARGCLNNAILNNTIVNWGGNSIAVYGCQQVIISNNQMEYAGTADQYVEEKGMVYIDSNVRGVSQHINIDGNNFGGGTHLDYLIHVNNAEDTRISNNRFVSVNIAEVMIENTCARTNIRRDNWGVSQALNPRTDKYDLYIVSDNGINTIGTYREMPVQGSQTRRFYYRKNEDGIVSFTSFHVLKNIGIPTIATLPPYYRPSAPICAMAYSTDGDCILVKFDVNGTINIIGEIPSDGIYYTAASFTGSKYD